MLQDLLRDITGYFDFLIAQGYYVAFHNQSMPLQDVMSALTPYNINSNPYCLLIKSNQQAWTHCVERQGKVIDACKKGPFCGICYAGMGEYVFPILGCADQPVAFISVSGYRMEREESERRIKTAAANYHFSENALESAYAKNLRDPLPDERLLRAQIQPLCRMFELLNLRLSEMRAGKVENLTRSSMLSHAVVYIRRHYACRISVEKVAAVCHCSPSTLSHMFKKELGISLREYVRNLRMADARRLLRDTDMPVCSVSEMLGYENQNYFCAVFSKENGCSPTAFRQQSRTRQEKEAQYVLGR